MGNTCSMHEATTTYKVGLLGCNTTWSLSQCVSLKRQNLLTSPCSVTTRNTKNCIVLLTTSNLTTVYIILEGQSQVKR
jgi:hypothetical protein